MAVSARKHTVPAEGEAPRFQAINELGATINDFIPVANVTERAQVIANLTAEGAPPSTARPVFVWRADAPAATPIEFTTDGTTWRALAGSQAADITSISTGWSATDASAHRPRVNRVGNQVHLYGAVTRSATSGSGGDIVSIPAAFQPLSAGTRFLGAVVTSGGQVVELALASGRVLIPPGYATAGLGSGVVVPLTGSWLMD